MINYKLLMIWLLLSYVLSYREVLTTNISARDTTNTMQSSPKFLTLTTKITFLMNLIRRK